MGYFVEEMLTSSLWPILVYNISYKMNGNMYIETHPQDSNVVLISGPCKEWKEHISHYCSSCMNCL